MDFFDALISGFIEGFVDSLADSGLRLRTLLLTFLVALGVLFLCGVFTEDPKKSPHPPSARTSYL